MPYVYVYLDPRKPGIFEYGDYKFDYEPFYVGYGSQQTRMRAHLRDAKKHKGSEHPKFAKIHKIWAEGLDPILIQYQKNLSREKLAKTREVRDAIKAKIEQWCSQMCVAA